MVYREINFGGSPFCREIVIGQATMIDEISVSSPAADIAPFTHTFLIQKRSL